MFPFLGNCFRSIFFNVGCAFVLKRLILLQGFRRLLVALFGLRLNGRSGLLIFREGNGWLDCRGGFHRSGRLFLHRGHRLGFGLRRRSHDSNLLPDLVVKRMPVLQALSPGQGSGIQVTRDQSGGDTGKTEGSFLLSILEKINLHERQGSQGYFEKSGDLFSRKAFFPSEPSSDR